jgi:exodeoxyribonuclease VII large subunit
MIKQKLELPLLPQRLAIISVETSKGYGDFLKSTTIGIISLYLLFPSILRRQSCNGIIAQLERIKKVIHHFDAVAIIRGGGGDVGLSCYNKYELAKANCTIPYSCHYWYWSCYNETVCEMIAHTNAITPTKLAEYLLQNSIIFRFQFKRQRKIIDKANG